MTMRVRVDKWLWCARFYKTRTLATEAVASGKVRINDIRPKPAHTIKVGDRVVVSAAHGRYEIDILVLGEGRVGPALAQTWYVETEASKNLRAIVALGQKMAVEPDRKGRPTKRDRRLIGRWQDEGGAG